MLSFMPQCPGTYVTWSGGAPRGVQTTAVAGVVVLGAVSVTRVAGEWR
jgi:hypothetical protein